MQGHVTLTTELMAKVPTAKMEGTFEEGVRMSQGDQTRSLSDPKVVAMKISM